MDSLIYSNSISLHLPAYANDLKSFTAYIALDVCDIYAPYSSARVCGKLKGTFMNFWIFLGYFFSFKYVKQFCCVKI